jgi:hypothetical protein
MTEVSDLSPDDQLTGFSKRPLLPMLLLALVLHVLLIGGTSIGYALDLLNPPVLEESVSEPTSSDDEPAATDSSDAAASTAAADEPADAAPVNSVRAEVDAMKADEKAVNKEYIEETFGATEEPPEDLGPSEDLLDF